MEDSKLQEQQQQQPQDSPQGDAAQQKQPPPAKEVIGMLQKCRVHILIQMFIIN